MKFTTIDQLTDEIVGQKGTADRDNFEFDLRMDIIGTLIKEAREKRNMSRLELGQIIGVQQTQISKLENNTKDTSFGTIIRALKALDANVKLSVELESKEELIITGSS